MRTGPKQRDVGSNTETGMAPGAGNTMVPEQTAKAAIRCWQASYMKLNIISGRQSSAKFRFRKPKEWEQQVALSLK